MTKNFLKLAIIKRVINWNLSKIKIPSLQRFD